MKTILYIAAIFMVVNTFYASAQTCDPPCAHGTCKAGNSCLCDASSGYTGSRCEVPLCNKYSLQCRTGVCVAPNVCNCIGTGFTGDDCSIPVCSKPCQNNGTCISPETCKCTTGWVGDQCQTPQCNEPIGCGPGTCVAPETCNCPAGWSGQYCTIPHCDPPCANGGTCYGPNACDCSKVNYTGDLCTIPTCNPTCRNGGECISPNVCNCTKAIGWTGPGCADGICAQPCLNGGRCSAPDVCDCTGTGYAGAQCEVEINECLLKPAVCDSRTTCTNTPGNFTCSDCPAGYTGGRMPQGCVDINECLGDYCDPVATCSNTNGSYTCGPCPSGYSGNSQLSQGGCKPICDMECLHGICGAPQTCNCTGGYTGESCNISPEGNIEDLSLAGNMGISFALIMILLIVVIM